jgi:hypothetical protein
MKNIVVTTAFGFIGVILAGMLFYRLRLFDPAYPYFQIVELGFIGAVLFPLFLYREKKETALAIILLFILHFIIFRSTRPGLIIRDIIIISSAVVSVMLYAVYLVPVIKRKYKILKVFSLSFLYALVNALAFTLLMIIQYIFFDISWRGFGDALFRYVQYGFIIGFGLSVGFNFAELLIKKYKHDIFQ